MFEANCAADEVIVMQSARFGRMRIGRCIEVSLGYEGCGADVMYIMDEHCSGMQSCQIQVGDKNMKERSSCVKGLEQYLDASYSCKKGKYSCSYYMYLRKSTENHMQNMYQSS